MKSFSSAMSAIVKIGLLAFVAMVVYRGFIAGPSGSRSAESDLYAELSSSSEARHRSAVKSLINRGPEAVEVLRDMAVDDDGGMRRAAFQALREMYGEADGELADAIDDCLFELSDFDSEDISAGARYVLFETQNDRFVRVAARLEELGAKVIAVTPRRREPVISGDLMMVELGPEWRGAEIDLQLLRRLPRLHLLYVDEESSVTSGMCDRLRDSSPRLRIISQGFSCLGFTGHDILGGFQIYTVEPASPASVAGMLPGDVLYSLNEMPIENFADVLNALSNHSPGDRITLEVRRAGGAAELQPILGSYQRSTELGVHCSCVEEPNAD